MSTYWNPPPYLAGETVVIIGGGPSMKTFDLSGIEKFSTIGVNNAFRLHTPDFLFYADTRWWRWNGHDVKPDFPGRIVSVCSCAAHMRDPRVLHMGRDQSQPLSPRRGSLAGLDGGYMSINLAVQMGAKRIILLGFDMGFDPDGDSHWHEEHQVRSKLTDYHDVFFPTYAPLVEALRKAGVEIYRCTPSRLTFIPEITWDEAKALPKRS